METAEIVPTQNVEIGRTGMFFDPYSGVGLLPVA